ncbi:mycofactocin system transcriptional regulator [Gordonia jinhuaensis]|uniref:Transcriptional regulatory protein TetR n=1 Tax=Gordonia jinhuaensis TaxID=1517702 RepID=A0A916WUE5_9ACTN|nr:mycofactocin system transcriptional regulator [Gordonia jinhuaensis]GGB30707.1 putative transcriptional regulatory protein TetR [Gordonia jinhuaensis]
MVTTSDSTRPARGGGRPDVTSRDDIERAAFRLFGERGFAETTVDDIAAAVGIGRRTFFRYFESKNDIAWGRFDDSLQWLRQLLRDSDPALPLAEVIQAAVVRFNRAPDDADPPHSQRMALILTTPALQAHSALRYVAWREVIADYVAERRSESPTDFVPRLIGQVTLALSLAAYETWLDGPTDSLENLLDESMAQLRAYLQP